MADNSRCVMSGPLSRTAAYSLVVNGSWGPSEITNLVRMLQLQAELLVSDEKDEANERHIAQRLSY